MRSRVVGVAFSVLVSLAACEPALPPIPPGAPLTAAPMHLVQRGHDPVLKLVDVTADGSIRGPQGQLLGKIRGNEVVDEKGKVTIKIGPDGAVTGTEFTRALKFNGEGALTDEKGVIRIGSDGVVIMMEANGDITRTPLQFEQYDGATRRTAAIVLVLVAKHLESVADLGIE